MFLLFCLSKIISILVGFGSSSFVALTLLVGYNFIHMQWEQFFVVIVVVVVQIHKLFIVSNRSIHIG